MMQQGERHRLRLWLRGERALGLKHVFAPGVPAPTHIEPAASGDISLHAAASVPHVTERADERKWTEQSETASTGIAVAAAQATPPPGALFASTGGTPSGAIAPPSAFIGAELAPAAKVEALRILDETEVRGCMKCPLCHTRRNTVFGEGNADAKLMFVGEGPGGTEDQTGRPFVGRAGQKLTEMIKAMGLEREQVYICNVVKCRAYLPGPPPKDRPPQPTEASTCMPYLQRQIGVVRPRVIVTLGLSASQYLLGVKESMSRMRGKWRSWSGIQVMPTFHPSYILRNYTSETRRAVWEDLKQVRAALAETGPGAPED